MKLFGDTQSKSLSPDMQAFLAGTDLEEGPGTKYTTAYAQSAWIYAAVNAIAKQVAKIPFRISRVGSDRVKRVRALQGSVDPRHRNWIRRTLNENIIESGPVVDLFANPHPSMDANLFWEMVITWNCLRGEFFIMPMDGDDQPVDLAMSTPRVERMLTVPPELFWHVVAGYTLEAWRYTGSPLITPIPSQILLPTEVIHSRSPNPYLYWRGMSPLIPADVAAKTDFAGEQYLKGLWINNADTGVIVTTEQQPDAQQRAAIQAALRERKRKAGTADRPLFLWGGAKVEKPGLSMMDMQYLETRKFLRKEIQAILEVPDVVMGYTDEKSSALSGGGQAISAERLQFIIGPIGNHCRKSEVAVNRMINAMDSGLVGWFDIESLPEMQEARRARMATATEAFGIGIPLNDINTTYDLGFPKYPWGNKSFLPFNLQEVSAAGLANSGNQPGEDEPPSTKPESDADEDNEVDPEKKPGAKNLIARALGLFGAIKAAVQAKERTPDVEALWNHHMHLRKSSVNLFKGKVNKVLWAFRKTTLAKLETIHLEKAAGRLPTISASKAVIDLIFNPGEFGMALNNELQAPIKGLLDQAGQEASEEIGVKSDANNPWKYPPQGVLDYLADRKEAIMGTGQTVRDQLNTSLQEGIEKGETSSQLADRVKGVFNKLTQSESERIARTEVNIAYNTARHKTMTDAGIQFKAWLSSHGPHVRPSHAAAEIKYIENPIPIDEPFKVMGELLMFPGDGSMGASAGNIINCQCIQLAAKKKAESEKSITYLVFGKGAPLEMEFMKEAA